MLNETNQMADILDLPPIEAPEPVSEPIAVCRPPRDTDRAILRPRCFNCGHELTRGVCVNCDGSAA